jgi:hypothetical protein
VALQKERGKLLRSRHLQYLLAFSYWPPIEPRAGPNIYEMRSYNLKPGTMIEWGNNWARAINYRRNNDEAFAAFFSQIGRLYNVHHVWCKEICLKSISHSFSLLSMRMWFVSVSSVSLHTIFTAVNIPK